MTNATIPCAPPVVPTGTAQIAQCTLSQSAGRAAPFSGNFQAEYTRPVMDGMNGFVRTLVTFYGNSTNDAANLLDDYKSYAISNLYAGVRSDNGAWEITAYAKNLFNTLRVLDRSAIAASVRNVNGIPASNYRQISTNDPREFGLSFRYAFGSR